MDKDDIIGLHNEISIMQHVDHPHIVKYFETYDDKKYVYLCMELCTGGEFFASVIDSGIPLSEKEASI